MAIRNYHREQLQRSEQEELCADRLIGEKKADTKQQKEIGKQDNKLTTKTIGKPSNKPAICQNTHTSNG